MPQPTLARLGSAGTLVTYRAVIFDIGGVILPSPFEGWAEYEVDLNLPVGFIRRVVASTGESGAWAKLERAEIDLEDFYEEFEKECEAAGGRVSAREVLSRLGFGAGGPRDEMVRALLRLREEGLKTAALTNNWRRDSQADGERSQAPGWDSLFDHVVESSKLGLRKPNPQIYLYTCELLEVQPSEAIFLDDLGVNLKPARDLGMTTIKVVEAKDALTELEGYLGFSLS